MSEFSEWVLPSSARRIPHNANRMLSSGDQPLLVIRRGNQAMKTGLIVSLLALY